MDIKIRKLYNRDARKVAKLHMAAFPNFFLSFLGERFLIEFYRSFTEKSKEVGLVAQTSEGKLLGVVVGPRNPSGFFRRLLVKRWPQFCLAGSLALIKRPLIAPRFFRAIFYRGESPRGPVRALLSSIAVAPEAQGAGVGRALVDKWVEQMRTQGVLGCYLTTDAIDNAVVNSFYKSLGWKLESVYLTPEGRKMNRYVLAFQQ